MEIQKFHLPRIRGLFRLLILYVLKNGPLHGYGIANELEKIFNYTYRPSPGILYPTLKSLEEEGLVVSWKEGRRKLYKLTEKGLDEVSKSERKIKNLINGFKQACDLSRKIGLTSLLKTIWKVSKCKIDPNTLEKVREHILAARELLRKYEEEALEEESF